MKSRMAWCTFYPFKVTFHVVTIQSTTADRLKQYNFISKKKISWIWNRTTREFENEEISKWCLFRLQQLHVLFINEWHDVLFCPFIVTFHVDPIVTYIVAAINDCSLNKPLFSLSNIISQKDTACHVLRNCKLQTPLCWRFWEEKVKCMRPDMSRW